MPPKPGLNFNCPHAASSRLQRRHEVIYVLVIFYLSLRRTTPKTQYTGCSVHENNNGQAAFENPMYNTNTKAVEGKAVRFDPNLNTVCTMVWRLIILTGSLMTQISGGTTLWKRLWRLNALTWRSRQQGLHHRLAEDLESQFRKPDLPERWRKKRPLKKKQSKLQRLVFTEFQRQQMRFRRTIPDKQKQGDVATFWRMKTKTWLMQRETGFCPPLTSSLRLDELKFDSRQDRV